jgi:hypothetical protein
MRLQSGILRALVAAGVFAVLAAPALAIPVFDPPWVTTPTDPRWQGGAHTFQAWEFTQNPTGPVIVNNPYGTPNIHWPTGATYPDNVVGPDGTTTIPTWHIGQDGVITIEIPNNPEDRMFKVIHLQITSDKATGQPTSSPGGAFTSTGIANHAPTAWYTYAYELTIQPNPPSETITIPVIFSTNIEEIIITTICNPEPGSLALLMLGGVALLRRRRVA